MNPPEYKDMKSWHLIDKIKILGWLIDDMVETTKKMWPEACEAAKMTTVQQNLFTNSAVLNPFCFYD